MNAAPPGCSRPRASRRSPARPRCCGALPMHAGDDAQARALANCRLRGAAALRRRRGEGCWLRLGDARLWRVLPDDPAWAGARRRSSRACATCPSSSTCRSARPTAPGRAGRLPRRLPSRPRAGRAHAAARPAARDARPPARRPPDRDLCCGSAGIYNLLHPGPASQLGERKARNLLDTGAEAVVAGNPGCALQTPAHTERLGRPLPVSLYPTGTAGALNRVTARTSFPPKEESRDRSCLSCPRSHREGG